MRTALVTGASRGIGRAIALALGRAGVAVAAGFRTNADGARAVAEAITAGGGRALAVELAVEERASVRAAVAGIRRRLGPLGVLVNNAGIAQEKPFAQITDADWDRMLAVNLRGAFTCCQEVLPDMLSARWGRIVNVASVGGFVGGWRQVHYAAAKAGLVSLTRSLARIYGPQGVTVNAVAPGLVPTDMTAAELAADDGEQKLAALPLGRPGTVEEVAAAVAFLVAESASYVTGQTLGVNGGMYFG